MKFIVDVLIVIWAILTVAMIAFATANMVGYP